MEGLAYGDSGHIVSTLQTHLHELGLYRGRIDGHFGRKTLEAVAAFQAGWLVTGRLDEYSTGALLEVMGRLQNRYTHGISPPHGLPEIEAIFGRIEYESTDGGNARITNGWDELHIEAVDLPIVGRTEVHRRMAPIFTAALAEVELEGLGDEIRQFAVWSVRHKMHNRRRGLSSHSWAISADINWARNPVGTIGTLHPEIVAIFEHHGFQWGGRFRKVRDDMHLQYCTGY